MVSSHNERPFSRVSLSIIKTKDFFSFILSGFFYMIICHFLYYFIAFFSFYVFNIINSVIIRYGCIAHG